ncbi:MAG: glucokinase [Nitrospirae bacterium]|nr:glucokinase [Nitrospirota bacterium]
MILAGDIGGTKTTLGIFESRQGEIVLKEEQSFPSRRYASFEAVLKEFLKDKKVKLGLAAFGVAGPVLNGRSETTNLPWVIDASQIVRQFEIPSVFLLNDLEAAAFGTLLLKKDEIKWLQTGEPDPDGPRAVIAAGTGLGESILFCEGGNFRTLASEGGHCDFAPRNPLEIRLLEYLWKRFGHASYERVLSGSGLFNLYSFLKESGDKESGHDGEPAWIRQRLEKEDPAAVISEVALKGENPLCVRALDLFVSIYGAEGGNLVLKTMATGGLYIGGGIASRILSRLMEGPFIQAFQDKGRFSAFMRRIPVGVILNEKAPLSGAAQFAFLKQ